jgi:hydrogenase expression/formation protein HypC
MCLALPARVVALHEGSEALIELGGVRKTVSVALTPGVAVGDYVIVHVGHAIGVIDAAEAELTLALFAELAASDAGPALPAGSPPSGGGSGAARPWGRSEGGPALPAGSPPSGGGSGAARPRGHSEVGNA